MAAINFAHNAPVLVDPRQSPDSRIRSWHVHADANAVVVDIEYLDANGDVIRTEQERFDDAGGGTAVTDWIAAQRNDVANVTLARKGWTATIT